MQIVAKRSCVWLRRVRIALTIKGNDPLILLLTVARCPPNACLHLRQRPVPRYCVLSSVGREGADKAASVVGRTDGSDGASGSASPHPAARKSTSAAVL